MGTFLFALGITILAIIAIISLILMGISENYIFKIMSVVIVIILAMVMIIVGLNLGVNFG